MVYFYWVKAAITIKAEFVKGDDTHKNKHDSRNT